MALIFQDLIKLINFKESNSWVWWQAEYPELAESFSRKKRPWFCYDIDSDFSDGYAVALPKTTKEQSRFYKYPKNQDFDKDGWVPPLRKTIDTSKADFHCIENDPNLKEKIFEFYSKKSWKIKEL